MRHALLFSVFVVASCGLAYELIAAALLMPLAVGATWAGVWLVRRIDSARFYTLIYLLMVALGMRLVWQGLA